MNDGFHTIIPGNGQNFSVPMPNNPTCTIPAPGATAQPIRVTPTVSKLCWAGFAFLTCGLIRGQVVDNRFTINSQGPQIQTNSQTQTQAQVFTVTYTDQNGLGDVSSLYFNVSNTSGANATQSCFLSFYAPTQTISLLNDAGISWESITPRANLTVSNGQCSLDGTLTVASTYKNSYTIQFALRFWSQYANSVASLWGMATGQNAASGTIWPWKSLGTVQPAVIFTADPHSSNGLAFVFERSSAWQVINQDGY